MKPLDLSFGGISCPIILQMHYLPPSPFSSSGSSPSFRPKNLKCFLHLSPEKLWVGPGSKAAEEKHFFDSHLAPFYRIEQVSELLTSLFTFVFWSYTLTYGMMFGASPYSFSYCNREIQPLISAFSINKAKLFILGVLGLLYGCWLVNRTCVLGCCVGCCVFVLDNVVELVIATIPELEHGNPPSIITDENIELLFEIQRKVDGIRVNYSGSLISLHDICLKPLGQDCATQSILQYYQMDPENYDNYGGVEHAEYCFQHYTSSETCFSAFKAPLDPTTALGGFSGNNFSEASAFIITYPVNNAIADVGDGNGKAITWEKAFIKLAKEELLPMVKSSNLTLSFSAEISIEEELKRESTADVITILVSYLLMFAYISVTLGDTPHLSTFYISSKVLLGLSGIVLVMLSVLGSVGFFSVIGVKSTLIIMEVIPFLVLAVGVDNMCILVHAMKRQSTSLPIEERICNALGEVGPSITLASISEILAFAVGSFISMPACRVFSMFAALAVLLDFLLQITAFVALVTLDFMRAEDNRIDCFPCIEEVHAPILGVWGVKIVVIAIFVAFTLASIALCPRIERGLEQKIVLPRDSYLQGYFNNISEYLRVGPPLYFVVKDYNYRSLLMLPYTLQISRASLVQESSYIAKPAASWLDDFLVWISPEAFGCCRKFINGSYCPPDDQPPCCLPDEGLCGFGGVCKDCTTCFRHSDLVNDRPSTAQFREKLPWFLDALPSADCAKGGHGAYTNSELFYSLEIWLKWLSFLLGYENGVIRASEFRTYHTPLNRQGDYVNAMQAARDFSSRISDSLKDDITGAVFVVCLVITSSVWSSAIILVVLVMIIVDLMGVMAILEIQLNAVSVVNLIMSIGIAVEFCVHIAHAFMVCSGDRNQRATTALCTMGASVFSGITLTKLVGVLVLCFSRSEIFVVYYFQMYLALVVIGFLHGLVFLPVALSLFGPPSKYRVIKEEPEDMPPASS
ncbi:NPC intracellular cholesterol transporter 1-like [Senna tora]|uniref:NPC intracellular cholesterol transporter 1-like n=1 Tax=Senna tora TaxID=362788 RepID=A0A834SVD2_9FABA|nr:NPC intracellular cholesterol transporter 1-like [Senna tora]